MQINRYWLLYLLSRVKKKVKKEKYFFLRLILISQSKFHEEYIRDRIFFFFQSIFKHYIV
jgi:hypothetical protein